MNPGTALRERFVTWALRVRPPEPSPIVLTQHRVYVLPTRAGLAYSATVLVLLLGAINYNLGLGYALTFLLAGLGVATIFHTFRNQARLTIRPGRAEPAFAGGSATFQLALHNDRNQDKRRIRLRVLRQPPVETDVPGHGSALVGLSVPAPQRGWLPLPRVTVDTTYPLGLIRAWSYCAPDARCLIYPRPADAAPPLPVGEQGSGSRIAGGRGTEDFSGLRTYQPADPLRHVAWKIAARQGNDSPLLTKEFAGAAAAAVWLDWDGLPPGLGEEARLSLLTRWALDAESAGRAWGLRLPERTFPLGNGDRHLHDCLKALALHGQAR